MFNAEEIGNRIYKVRLRKGFKSQEALAAECRRVLNKKKQPDTLTRQTIQNWEAGKNIPPWDMVALLSEVLGIGEEDLLFGERRSQQLSQERQLLIHLNQEEAKLVTAFRRASVDGRRVILTTAVGISRDLPGPEAEVVPIRT